MAIPDKRMTEEEVVGELRDGMTIGIGGWGSRRKPMSLVRAILRSDLKDLTIVSYGGPDIGLLCAAGKVRKAVYGFVSLDSIPLEPHFRLARQSGSLEAMELDEGMLLLGLQAAAWRVPFLPTRAGLGTDLPRVMPELQMITSPYPGPDGGEPEELLAMPALPLDAALIHMNRADQGGNGQFLGSDLFMDDLMAMAAGGNTSLSCEQVIPTEDFAKHGSFHTQRISRLMTAGVVEAPGGAHFTECPPDYGRDEAFQREYALAAASPETWDAFKQQWLDLETEAEYQKAVAARRAEGGSR
jgi:glutaconate CoA-transferase subunit A